MLPVQAHTVDDESMVSAQKVITICQVIFKKQNSPIPFIVQNFIHIKTFDHGEKLEDEAALLCAHQGLSESKIRDGSGTEVTCPLCGCAPEPFPLGARPLSCGVGSSRTRQWRSLTRCPGLDVERSWRGQAWLSWAPEHSGRQIVSSSNCFHTRSPLLLGV